MAEGGAVGARTHVIDAGREQRARTEVGLDDGVGVAGVALVVVDVRVGILRGQHYACAYAAAGVEWTGNVGHAAIAAPRAGAGIEGTGKFAGGPLAHQVDGGGRIAGACQEPGRAAHHFHVVVDGAVADGGGVLVGAVEGVRHAVELEVFDGIAARIKGGAFAVVAAHGHTHGFFQDVGHGDQCLVVHLLARDHADRLRRFACGQAQAGGGAHGTDAVGAAAFGDVVGFAPGRDADGGQRLRDGRSSSWRGDAAHAVAALSLRHYFQAAAGQQRGKTGGWRMRALQAGRSVASGQRRIERQRGAGGGCKLVENRRQRAGGNLVVAGGLGGR